MIMKNGPLTPSPRTIVGQFEILRFFNNLRGNKWCNIYLDKF